MDHLPPPVSVFLPGTASASQDSTALSAQSSTLNETQSSEQEYLPEGYLPPTYPVYQHFPNTLNLHTSITYAKPLVALPPSIRALFAAAESELSKELFVLGAGSTIFHPQGGGQPSDVGTIRGLHRVHFVVKTVRKTPHGEIFHLGTFLPNNLTTVPSSFEPGDSVLMEVNWKTRVLNSRFHTAGHILGHAVETVASEAKLLKANLFPGVANMQFSCPSGISISQQAEIRALVASIVLAKKPVHGHWWGAEEAAEKCTSAHNRFLIGEGETEAKAVEIEGVGSSLCVGTHVKNTGSVGRIVIKKFTRKGTSVSFDVVDS